MKLNEALSIFENIGSIKYTDEEKGESILTVLKMETHNSVTKAAMLNVIRYLLNLAFDVPEEAL